MKTFEERFTAWLDGVLNGEELRSFERENRENPFLIQQKGEYLKLKSLLKNGDCRPELANPDFFTSQIMSEIRRAGTVRSSPKPRLWFGLPRLAWGGVGVLSIGLALFFVLIPRGNNSDPRANYVAEVLNTKTADPKVKATVENQKDMTIIKLEGLDRLPPQQDLHH
jgi:hypothetical protein